MDTSTKEAIYFVDTFTVPRASVGEFTVQVKINRDFIATLPGYVRGEVLERID